MHLSVSQLADYLRGLIDIDPNLSDLWIEGEVSDPFFHNAGHVFFQLIDGSEALIKCVLFARYPGADLLSHGVSINAHGRVSFYKVRGDLQLYVDSVQPSGLGIVALETERLRAQLAAEGMFEPSRKRRLPDYPRRIGVATSDQGAVFHDISTIISRRYPISEIVLCPTPVQGVRAIEEIASAIRTLDSFGDVDVIIVARGGGSLEDLAAFNSEIVARAIFGSRVPIVSAVGHETDITIADEVADYRAPTPSAAAEAVTPDRKNLLDLIDVLVERSWRSYSNEITRYQSAETRLSERLMGALPDVVQIKEKLERSIESLFREFASKIKNDRQGFEIVQSNFVYVSSQIVQHLSAEVNAFAAGLKALDPLGVLNRGYSILTQGPNQTIVHSITEIGVNDSADAILSDGQLEIRVLSKKAPTHSSSSNKSGF